MYQVSLYNNGVETIVHYPTADSSAPHVNKLSLKEGLSLVDSLSFNLYINNDGYNQVFELTTRVKVIDTRDDSIRFTGRILNISDNMDSSGLFYKEILCEGALSYFNDTKQRSNTFATTTPEIFLTQILAIHNAKVDSSKQIQVGNVDVTGSVAYTCEFKTTLDTILAVKDIIGGDVKVRETNGILYMDWLQSFNVNTVNVALGENMKDMVKYKDVTSFGTHIIPLGANNLTIESVNGGLDYIEDAASFTVYGAIEKTVEYKDITDATALKNACIADLSDYTQPTLVLQSNALDLSYLTGNKAEQFVLGTDIHLTNSVMAIDDTYKVIKIELDLLAPYNPTLTIANAPITLTSTINDLRASSVQNNGVYNGVQIGSAYGVRVVRSDNKVTTTVNATEGISIENDSKKVFFVDDNGILNTVEVIAKDMTAINGTYTNITAEGGTFTNATIENATATNGTFTNVAVLGTFTTGVDGTNRTIIDGNGIESRAASGEMAGLVCNQPSSTDAQRFADLLLYWSGNVIFQVYNGADGSVDLISYGTKFLNSTGSATTAKGLWKYENSNTTTFSEIATQTQINHLQSQIDALTP